MELARNEYWRRIAAGQENVQVLLARSSNLRHWLDSGVNEEHHCAFIETLSKAKKINKGTKVDLYITKIRNQADNAIKQSVLRQVTRYDILHCQGESKMDACGGWDMVLSGLLRRPTLVFHLGTDGSGFCFDLRAVMDVDICNRCMPQLHGYCLEYFDLIPTLRALIAFKIFHPSTDDHSKYPALIVVYRRIAGIATVVDAVSFGAERVPRALTLSFPPPVCAALRVLPVAPTGPALQQANPWQPADRAFVDLAREDLFYSQDAPDGSALLVDGAPAEDLRICLWTVLADASRQGGDPLVGWQ